MISLEQAIAVGNDAISCDWTRDGIKRGGVGFVVVEGLWLKKASNKREIIKSVWSF